MALLPAPQTRTVDAIYAWHEAADRDGFRPHLGASLVGLRCDRALWYSFRWVARAVRTGRILRLFETGNLEEKRLVTELRRIGVTILDIDPATGRQWRLQALGGHFGGSVDAVGVGFPEAPKTWHIVEFKTHNSKSFADLRANGVEAAKYQHWAQVQVYMYLAGLDRAMYLAVCKNDDALYQERIRLDTEAAKLFITRAERVIDATAPPDRISEDPDSRLGCRWCGYRGVCHFDAQPLLNCRTCRHSSPIANAHDGTRRCRSMNNGKAAPRTFISRHSSPARRSPPTLGALGSTTGCLTGASGATRALGHDRPVQLPARRR